MTNCPHCGTTGSVPPLDTMPALVLIAPNSDESELYGEQSVSTCLACHAVVGA